MTKRETKIRKEKFFIFFFLTASLTLNFGDVKAKQRNKNEQVVVWSCSNSKKKTEYLMRKDVSWKNYLEIRNKLLECTKNDKITLTDLISEFEKQLFVPVFLTLIPENVNQTILKILSNEGTNKVSKDHERCSSCNFYGFPEHDNELILKMPNESDNSGNLLHIAASIVERELSIPLIEWFYERFEDKNSFTMAIQQTNLKGKTPVTKNK